MACILHGPERQLSEPHFPRVLPSYNIDRFHRTDMNKYILPHDLAGEKQRLRLMSEMLDPLHRSHIEKLEPDAHGLIPRAERLHVADTVEPGDRVFDVQGGVVRQVRSISLSRKSSSPVRAQGRSPSRLI